MDDFLERPLCFFDLETTGVDVAKDRIVEIAMCKKPADSPILQTLHLYVNPGIPIPAEASAVHGLTMETLQYEKPFADLAPQIFEFVKGCDLAGHNIMGLDVPILVEEFIRAGIAFPEPGIQLVDTFHLQAKIAPRTLEYVYTILTGNKWDKDKGHGALYDTERTVEVYEAQTQNWGNVLGTTRADLHTITTRGKHIVDFAGKFTLNDKFQVVWNFGKHVGKRVTCDLNYLDWFLKGDFTRDSKRWANDCIKHNDDYGKIMRARDPLRPQELPAVVTPTDQGALL